MATTIAVIEDQGSIRHYVSDLLLGRGYTVMTYPDCASARLGLAESPPDLILTDLNLPDGDGLELLEDLKLVSGGCPVPSIVVSACHDEARILRAFEAGAVDYLTKPFPPDELLAKSQLALRKSERLRRAKLERDRDTQTAKLSTITPGKLVSDRYALAGELGRGAFGAVYAAYDTKTGRRVALKFAKLGGHADPEARERFMREVYTLGSIRSPHVVELVGSSIWDGAPLLAMEFIQGRTLESRVEDFGVLGAEEARLLLGGLARAALCLEQVGLVHRDIKPSNILLRDDDASKPVLIDFGLAKQQVDRGITSEDLIQGTPGYICPEVLTSEEPTHLSDQFSIGVSVLYAVTGEQPFPRLRGMDLLRRMACCRVPVPESLPAWLHAALRRLTSLVAAERHQTARDLLEHLEGLDSECRGGARSP